MKKTQILLLIIALLGASYDGVSAAITQRIIHAGDTPLASTCTVVQTDSMELTVSACSFTTTGEAKIIDRFESVFAALGAGPVAQALRENKAEWYGSRVRVWLRDKQGNIIERSATYILPVANLITVPIGGPYFIYLVKNPGLKMEAILLSTRAPRPTNYVHYLAFEFTVPAGTTDLSGIEIEVFTVLPGFPAPKGLFEK